MNNLNKFAFQPVNLDISRSRFPIPYDHKTTFMSGDLVPFYISEVTSGDTFSCDLKSLTKMLTPVVPTMDNLLQDVWFFYVPFRLCTKNYNDWQKITGENFSGYWVPNSEATLQNTGNSFNFYNKFVTNDITESGGSDVNFKIYPQSLASYLGVPIGDYAVDEDDYEEAGFPNFISKMPFIAYWKIWNEFFRDQNTQAPIEDFEQYIAYANCNNKNSRVSIRSLCRVSKVHDLFTDLLPAPQKGPDVGVVLGGLVPVITSSARNLVAGQENVIPMTLKTLNDGTVVSNRGFNGATAVSSTANGDKLYSYTSNATAPTGQTDLVPDNLYVNIDNTIANVNGMRLAFAYQRFLEKSARGGSRYREYIKSQFNVSINEGFVQVPEYLGGHRFPLMISQVVQTFEESNSGPLGSLGAWSNTFNEFKAFTKSFKEQGYIIGLTAVRPMQSYSQGLPKLFSKNRIIDWYHPSFANIGEQALLSKEIYLNSSTNYANSVFGYQEAWYDYRYKPSYVSGYLAPQANSATFKPWTYCNYFTGPVYLNSSFKTQTEVQVANTLYDVDEPAQFIMEIYCDIVATRPMPLFSIPGLLDHH